MITTAPPNPLWLIRKRGMQAASSFGLGSSLPALLFGADLDGLGLLSSIPNIILCSAQGLPQALRGDGLLHQDLSVPAKGRDRRRVTQRWLKGNGGRVGRALMLSGGGFEARKGLGGSQLGGHRSGGVLGAFLCQHRRQNLKVTGERPKHSGCRLDWR